MSEPTATEWAQLSIRAEVAEANGTDLRAKLDAVERAYSEIRRWAVKACKRDRSLPLFPIAVCADAGSDYVPRSEVDAAWRKGMTDAAMIACGFTESMGRYKSMQTAATIERNILAARDAKLKSTG